MLFSRHAKQSTHTTTFVVWDDDSEVRLKQDSKKKKKKPAYTTAPSTKSEARLAKEAKDAEKLARRNAAHRRALQAPPIAVPDTFDWTPETDDRGKVVSETAARRVSETRRPVSTAGKTKSGTTVQEAISIFSYDEEEEPASSSPTSIRPDKSATMPEKRKKQVQFATTASTIPTPSPTDYSTATPPDPSTTKSKLGKRPRPSSPSPDDDEDNDDVEILASPAAKKSKFKSRQSAAGLSTHPSIAGGKRKSPSSPPEEQQGSAKRVFVEDAPSPPDPNPVTPPSTIGKRRRGPDDDAHAGQERSTPKNRRTAPETFMPDLPIPMDVDPDSVGKKAENDWRTGEDARPKRSREGDGDRNEEDDVEGWGCEVCEGGGGGEEAVVDGRFRLGPAAHLCTP
ncbi:uncharacterized protein LTR77_006457 [Saxophila tyrrhenica]|uniref:Uncharacterized protein n=1 Tax=Saxophila tyrrhenica TaxID=1690608 RepID=A0AAV9P7Y4_9PEZI|nr:hypothetical protein LTR77_006457 [Saxophila tyrrhenica]